MFGDERIQLLHRDRTPFARGFALGRAVRAGVVPIHSSTFRGVGAQGHAPATSCTHCQSRSRIGPVHPRACFFGLRAMQLSLDLFEGIDSMMAGISIYRDV